MLALWKTCVYPREKGEENMRTTFNHRHLVNICAQLYPQLSTAFTQIVLCALFFVYEVLSVIFKLSTATTSSTQIDNTYI